MNKRIVKIILSDNDLQGFEVSMIVDETTTENYLLNFVMQNVSDFLVEHNLINIQERLFNKTLHIHNWVPSEIYMESTLYYYVCTGCADTINDEDNWIQT